MRAMILCAGEGRRLCLLTRNCPKPMLPVAGKPLLEYNIEWLKRHGITEMAVNLHCYPKVIRDYGIRKN